MPLVVSDQMFDKFLTKQGYDQLVNLKVIGNIRKVYIIKFTDQVT